MKISGAATLAVPVDRVWAALLDPAVLVRTIPGCERLEVAGPDQYALVVSAGVASIRGTYSGSCALSDLCEGESLKLTVNASGSSGTVTADVAVRFTDLGGGTTGLSYDADAIVGGMLGGVGQRLLGSVSKRMADEFFGNVERAVVGAGTLIAEDVTASPSGVFVAPPRPSAPTDLRSFIAGVAVGAGLVAFGVGLGWVIGRGHPTVRG